jgi:oligopeptide transport system substrate-binding protein
VGDGFFTSGHNRSFRSQGPVYIDPKKYDDNVAMAQAALAEAGYPNGEGMPRIDYLYNESSTHAMIGEAIQNMWKEALNLDMELRVAEWATVLVDRREGNFDVSRNGWIGDFNDPHTMLGLFVSSSENNDGKYNNPAFDAKMAESMRESDPAKRAQLQHEAEDIMLGQDWACAPVYYYCIEHAASPKLKGFTNSMLGYTFFHKAYLEQ